jgi:high-affinity Fe2+/Pb2+ permease
MNAVCRCAGTVLLFVAAVLFVIAVLWLVQNFKTTPEDVKNSVVETISPPPLFDDEGLHSG